MNQVEQLKTDGKYYEAGKLEAQLAPAYVQAPNYGCHYGMRSTREWAIVEFKRGWYEVRK